MPNSKEEQYNPRPDRLYRAYLLATIIGVVGGIIGLYFFILQTAATRKAAEAAFKNTVAIINAERAWVFVDRDTGGDRIQAPYLLPVGHQSVLANQEKVAHCIFFIKNFGKTPAKIVAWKAELQIGESANEPPSTTVYTAPTEKFGTYFIPPDNAAPQEARLQTGGFAEWKEFQDIEDHKRYAWLCGFVRYSDVLSSENREHETRFCYVWETRMNTPKPFWRLGPIEYNRAT